MSIDDISTNDLIDELTKRCTPAIFLGYKEEGIAAGGKFTFYEFTGDPHICYGLCFQLAMNIQRHILKEEDDL